MTNEMKIKVFDALAELGKKGEIQVTEELLEAMSDICYDLRVNLDAIDTDEDTDLITVQIG
jgi:hypothetical protein